MNDDRAADGTGLIADDPWLEPHRAALIARYRHYQERRAEIERAAGSLTRLALGYEYFGFNRGVHEGQPGLWYREWAPGADALALGGDFNGWDRHRHPLSAGPFGVWSLFLPDVAGKGQVPHGSRLKVHVTSGLTQRDRIPAYIRRVVKADDTHDFSGVYWAPPPFAWRHPKPAPPRALRVYEAHVGMAQEREGVGTFKEFSAAILPRIARLGYTAVQLMAVMQHPYYGSFGYQVSNFFAVSHYFGTPEDLKELIDAAHGLGLVVFLDLVHSHTVKNINEGLNEFDGTRHQYFHAGGRGEHWAWDSKLFDYGKFEVLRFLLSNVRFWLEEYRFDGFRFDGVTSMIYLDHGLHRAIQSYEDYFDPHNVDPDAVAYLQLANQLVHELAPTAITIAEEVSGVPGLARPVHEGGLGFDYRLSMGIPDHWIKLLKDQRDEDWHLGTIFGMLLNRRRHEKHVAYCESHDQALVGDKTIAFRLMDKAMYTDMARHIPSLVIDRGLALHKLIRLITYGFGGDAWLNFMGNEFGHPEWIDFPREGNAFSYFYARRQWSLVDNPFLRYQFLNDFDRALHQLEDEFHFLGDPLIELLAVHEDNKILAARRGPLVFLFNFHPTRSYTDYRFGAPDPAAYRVRLSTDLAEFGGFDRVRPGTVYPQRDEPWDERRQCVMVYLPSRTAQVLAPV